MLKFFKLFQPKQAEPAEEPARVACNSASGIVVLNRLHEVRSQMQRLENTYKVDQQTLNRITNPKKQLKILQRQAKILQELKGLAGEFASLKAMLA